MFNLLLLLTLSHNVAGVIDNDEVLFLERLSTDRKKTSLEYATLFKFVLDLHKINETDVDGAIISSVVPEISVVVEESLSKLFNTKPVVVGPGIKTGLSIKIDDPGQLGADMVAGAVAAKEEYPLPQIIFDLGTATTISAISKQGEFLGCAIAAGVRTSVDSIARISSQLLTIGFEMPTHTIGTNTKDSMISGSVLGTSSMMDGMIDKMERELGEKATVIATGGLAKYILPNCTHEIIYDNELILKGLNIIYKKNK